MRDRIHNWWRLSAVAVAMAGAAWLLYAVWRSAHRSDLATYGAFAVGVVTVAASWVAWARRAGTSAAARAAAGQDLDGIADLLAVAVRSQWERVAGERGLSGAEPIQVTWGRPSLPLVGPVKAAAGSQRFRPLPGVLPAGQARLAAGQIDDLLAVYGGLRSGRLVIAGPPGSGKSGAAVLLVLAALRHRDQVGAGDRVKVPVPVLFTVQDWDPRHQPVRQWLIERLQQTYPLFAGRVGAAAAGGLIDAGKIAVILDGLDEIAERRRPDALEALNPASFRLVVLSRTAEMASAAPQRGILQGAAAIELRAVAPATAADYLERVQLDPPPPGWRDLTSRLRAGPAGALAEALSNPLALTLIRDTYQAGDDARELLDYCDSAQQHLSGAQAAEQITGHLIDRVLPAAYAPRPGQPPPRYDLQTARNAFTKIAARMNQDGTRDLQWWRIPVWAPLAPWLITVGLGFGLATWLAFGLADGLTHGLRAALTHDLAGGVAAGVLAAGSLALASNNPPKRTRKLRLRRMLNQRSLTSGLWAGLAVGFLIGTLAGQGHGFWAGLAAGLLYGLPIGLATAVVSGLSVALADTDSTSSPSPADSWHDDQRYAIAVGLAAGIAAGLGFWFFFWLQDGVWAGLGVGIWAGLGFGFWAGLFVSQAWRSSLAAAHLARHWHTPAHLMRFLNDARQRNVLRTVGPVYQFRHALLQDRLAAASTSESWPYKRDHGPARPGASAPRQDRQDQDR